MTIFRGVLALGGLFYLFVGSQFLLFPVEQGGDFGLTANGNAGLSTIRADFAAFFGVSGGALLIGAWKRNGAVLLVTAALMGITLGGRLLSLALDGPYEAWFVPMLAEAITVILALVGSRILPESGQPT